MFLTLFIGSFLVAALVLAAVVFLAMRKDDVMLSALIPMTIIFYAALITIAVAIILRCGGWIQ